MTLLAINYTLGLIGMFFGAVLAFCLGSAVGYRWGVLGLPVAAAVGSTVTVLGWLVGSGVLR